MAILDTSNVIDSSIFLKAKLDKNMVGSNYYIENLQDKRDADWEFRYNVVGIEEELKKQIEYTQEIPSYTPIDVVIRNVKSIKGEDLGTDWANISFRDLKHPCGEGYRYRFSLDFPDMSRMDEEEKHFGTSIWLGVNKTPVKAGNTLTVRRCDTALTFVGSPTMDYNNITEIHYEPAILENEMKYMQVYYNDTMPTAQAEWYAIMQLNYFTNCIKINDRFLFGTINLNDRENNQVYKVKAITKSNTEHTFMRDHEDELKNTSLIILALDKEEISPNDDLENRVANNATMYQVDYSNSLDYYLSLNTPIKEIGLGDNYTFTCYVCMGDKVLDIPVNFEYKLNGIKEENWYKYFSINIQDNSFTIACLKEWKRGKLNVDVSCEVNGQELSDTFEITLESPSLWGGECRC